MPEISTEVSVNGKDEDWMTKKWRPAMGWTYMATCIFDFIIAPILWSLIQVIGSGKVDMQWQPITLQGAGLFHIAMGAVLGIAAFGRTQEKLGGVNNGGLSTPATMPMTALSPTPFVAKAPPPAAQPQL